MEYFKSDSWLFYKEYDFLLEKKEIAFKNNMMFDELKKSLQERAKSS
jgi:hypothetical protein